MKNKQILIERFINLFDTPQDKEKKQKYADEVWDILQKSYAKIGGIAGSGFKSKEDMIDNIPFWKLATSNGKVVAVRMYKEKFGRKGVASGTDGSEEGKKKFSIMSKDDITRRRSYSEVSSAALSFLVRKWDEEKYGDLEKYLIKPEQAQKILDDKLYFPVPEDDAEAVKYPHLKDYFYQREIGGHKHTKLMVGTPHQSLK